MDVELHERVEEGRTLPYLLCRLPADRLVLTSAPVGGGLGPRRWVINAQVPIGYDRTDLAAHIDELRRTAGLPDTPGVGLWQKARAYLLDDPGRYQLLLVAGLVGMVPFLALEAVGFVILARSLPWAAVFAGGDAQIPPADGAGADRARRHAARAPAGAEALAHVPEKWEPVFR